MNQDSKPAPFNLGDHVRYVATIIELLHAHMPVDKALAETPVITQMASR